MLYELIIKPSAEKALDCIPRATRQRLLDRMRELRIDPRPSSSLKLAGEDVLYRFRVGDDRIVDEIQEEELIVYVVRIAHRKDAYRK